jgi:hypothetical protein
MVLTSGTHSSVRERWEGRGGLLLGLTGCWLTLRVVGKRGAASGRPIRGSGDIFFVLCFFSFIQIVFSNVWWFKTSQNKINKFVNSQIGL